MANSIKKILATTAILLTNLMFSQEEIPFTIRFQDYVKGDLTFIANNIVNRNDKNNANEDYNKLGSGSKLNDEFNMTYIDIDDDPTTFSSSSATYKNNDPDNELVYAGLYWAATYKYATGIKKKGVYSGEGKRDSDYTEIKVKIPGQKAYQNISGQIIFDGYKNNKYDDNSPYVCFHDMTELVKKNPFGDYTVANVKATQGTIEGGVSAGWVMYFVYKNKKSPEKYVTLFDGFAYVFNKPILIKFLNFQTPKTGEINSKIAMSVLEGDNKIEGDNVRMKNQDTNKYYSLSNKKHEEQNFFNSQITIENEAFMDRKPASLNTLGFDALIVTIDNKDNKIIDNSATETNIKIASVGDKVYLFSSGFTIDVDEEFVKNIRKQQEEMLAGTKEEIVIVPTLPKDIKVTPPVKMEEPKIETPPVKIETPVILPVKVETPKIIEPKIKTPIKIEPKTPKTAGENADYSNKYSKTRRIKDIRKLTINCPTKSGYYIISNVFSVPKNAFNYCSKLASKKIKSDYFINPENSYRYIYLRYFDKLEDCEKAYDSNLENTFFDDYWIMEVNIN